MTINPDLALLSGPIRFSGRDGSEYLIRQLDTEYAAKHSRALKALHKLIPYVGRDAEFLSEVEGGDAKQLYRWSTSLAVEHQGKTIAFLTAYVRDYSERHPFRSAYIHRMSVAKDHQRNYVGAQLVASAVSLYFEAMPWLLTVTVQTNDEPKNAAVLAFYRRCGFRDRYTVEYLDKVDSLMEFERTNSTGPGSPFGDFEKLTTAPRSPVLNRLPNVFENSPTLECRTVFFGTTSNEKFLQYRCLLKSYGLRLQRLQHKISLTEPQIDHPGHLAESALVAGPLKLFSRFAAKNTSFPVMVEDTMLFIEHFNDNYNVHPILPGPDTKRWWMALRAEGVLRVLGASPRRAAKYVCQIGINYGPGQYGYFRHEQPGEIATAVRINPQSTSNFPYTNATFFHSIFIPQGSSRSLGEMDSRELLKFDYRRACIAKALPPLRQHGALDSQLGLFGIS
jgi:inosine/xanthosine triphosphate pyrophosphatase family protein/ribosomal protein S18 acetylase RimI-like enzyme